MSRATDSCIGGANDDAAVAVVADFVTVNAAGCEAVVAEPERFTRPAGASCLCALVGAGIKGTKFVGTSVGARRIWAIAVADADVVRPNVGASPYAKLRFRENCRRKPESSDDRACKYRGSSIPM